MGNLDMYNRYAEPPKDAQKEFNNGRFKGTDINPMWRIRVLTAEYGECGFGWYTEVNRFWSHESPETKEIAVFCELSLFVKRGNEWSKPIVGVGGNTFVTTSKRGLIMSDEAYKMAYTDALGIACKALGIGANVWWKSTDSKYMRQDELNRMEQGTQPPQDDGHSHFICSRCEGEINETLIDGKRYSAESIAKASVKAYGRQLCYSCKLKTDRERSRPDLNAEYEPA